MVFWEVDKETRKLKGWAGERRFETRSWQYFGAGQRCNVMPNMVASSVSLQNNSLYF